MPFGHTPLSIEERIPWKCTRLVIGTGTGALPVMKEVKREAKRRKIKFLILPTKGDQRVEAAARRNQRHPARHVLRTRTTVPLRKLRGGGLIPWSGAHHPV
jgi:hypothetical protein